MSAFLINTWMTIIMGSYTRSVSKIWSDIFTQKTLEIGAKTLKLCACGLTQGQTKFMMFDHLSDRRNKIIITKVSCLGLES